MTKRTLAAPALVVSLFLMSVSLAPGASAVTHLPDSGPAATKVAPTPAQQTFIGLLEIVYGASGIILNGAGAGFSATLGSLRLSPNASAQAQTAQQSAAVAAEATANGAIIGSIDTGQGVGRLVFSISGIFSGS